jgi:Phage integrase, N-terminal SAM-like domain.
MRQFNTSIEVVVQKDGPLAPYFDLFAKSNQDQGYSETYIVQQSKLLADFSRWLKKRRIDIHALTSRQVDRFLTRLTSREHLRRGDACTLRRLLELLRQMGVINDAEVSTPTTPIEQIIEAYSSYQREQRNLSQATLVGYVPFIRGFLTERFGQGPIDFASLCAIDIIGFIRRQAARLLPKRAKTATSALRSFLRYLRYRGDVDIDLAAAVPTVRLPDLENSALTPI